MMPAVSVTVDVSSIQNAVALAIRSTGGRIDKLLGYTALYTAVRAIKYTPYVDLQTIDQEIDEVVATPTRGSKKKGGLAGLPWTRGMMIALARTDPNSAYSIATDRRWPLLYPFGHNSLERWRFFADAAERMIKARHSSTHFLQSGWAAVAGHLREIGFRSGPGMIEDSGMETISKSNNAILGAASRGGEGTDVQWVTIENLVGDDKKYPNLSAERNAALHDLSGPALQTALDEQAQWLRDHYLPKVGEEMAAEWNSVPDAAAFTPGTHVPSARMAEIQSIADIYIEGELKAFD